MTSRQSLAGRTGPDRCLCANAPDENGRGARPAFACSLVWVLPKAVCPGAGAKTVGKPLVAPTGCGGLSIGGPGAGLPGSYRGAGASAHAVTVGGGDRGAPPVHLAPRDPRSNQLISPRAKRAAPPHASPRAGLSERLGLMGSLEATECVWPSPSASAGRVSLSLRRPDNAPKLFSKEPDQS